MEWKIYKMADFEENFALFLRTSVAKLQPQPRLPSAAEKLPKV